MHSHDQPQEHRLGTLNSSTIWPRTSCLHLPFGHRTPLTSAIMCVHVSPHWYGSKHCHQPIVEWTHKLEDEEPAIHHQICHLALLKQTLASNTLSHRVNPPSYLSKHDNLYHSMRSFCWYLFPSSPQGKSASNQGEYKLNTIWTKALIPLCWDKRANTMHN